jgi:hypothetical protein
LTDKAKPFINNDQEFLINLYQNEDIFYNTTIIYSNLNQANIINTHSLINDIFIKPKFSINYVSNFITYSSIDAINSCFLKDFNITILDTSINGQGNFSTCYENVKKFYHSDVNPIAMNREAVFELLPDDIASFLNLKNITIDKLIELTQSICNANYNILFFKKTEKIDSICLRLIYNLVLAEDLRGRSYINAIKNDIEKIGEQVNWLEIFTPLLFLVFLTVFVFEEELIETVENIFFRNAIVIEYIDYDLLRSALNTLPMRKYIFKNHLNDLSYSPRDIFYNYSKYINMFVNIASSNKQLIEQVNKAIHYKTNLKVEILISKIQIVNTIILSFLTFKLFKIINLSFKLYSILLITFSFIYMSTVLLKSLKIIECNERIKALYINENIKDKDEYTVNK